MEHTALNLFDLGVGLVLVLSALLSFFRGFVREVLSLGAWMGACLITLYAFPHVAALLEHHIADKTIASGFGAILTFLLALILISALSGVLLKFMKSGADVGLLDHGMGLVFGLARGALLIAIGYFIFSLAVNKDDTPDWMKGSVTRPYVARTTHLLARLAPSYLDELTGDVKKKSADLDKKIAPDPDKKAATLGGKNTDDAPMDEALPVNNTPTAPADWPSAADLKQRVDDAAKEK